MSKTLRKIALRASYAAVFCAFGLVFAVVFFAISAHAQFIGYVSPQTVSTAVFNASSGLCDGAVHNGIVPNLGQTTHFITFSTTGNPVTFRINLAFTDSTGSFPISDFGTDPAGGVLSANGYYSVVQVQVQCTGGSSPTVTANYYGTSSNAVPLTGRQDITSYKRVIATADAANAGHTYSSIQSPYGNSCGQILFLYSATGVSGSTIAVNGVEGSQTFTVLPAQTILNLNTTQVINVPCFPASNIQVIYTSGGAGAQTYTLTYVFNRPGVQQPGGLSTPNSGTSSTLPIQTISDALSQAFLAGGALTNPAASTTLLNLNVNNGAKSIYLDKVYVICAGCSGTGIIELQQTSTAGSGCSTVTSANLKAGSSVASSSLINGQSCTGNPTGVINVQFATSAGGLQSIDARGWIAPAGTTTGFDCFVVNSSITGTPTCWFQWYEK